MGLLRNAGYGYILGGIYLTLAIPSLPSLIFLIITGHIVILVAILVTIFIGGIIIGLSSMLTVHLGRLYEVRSLKTAGILGLIISFLHMVEVALIVAPTRLLSLEVRYLNISLLVSLFTSSLFILVVIAFVSIPWRLLLGLGIRALIDLLPAMNCGES